MSDRRLVLLTALVGLLQACGGGGGSPAAPPPPSPPPPSPPPPGPPPPPPPGPPPAPAAPAWAGHAANAQHTALSAVASQALTRILWTTSVDLFPPYRNGGALLIHYGSPVITAGNTVLVPVKTTTTGDFRVEARVAATGALLWQENTDYILPPSSWTPSFNLGLDRNHRLYMPAAGGRLLLRDQADSATGTARALAFYGDSVYAANVAALNNQVTINTPLTVDTAGNVFFGFIATAGNPANLSSGFVRVAADGSAVWRGAAALAGDADIAKPAMNCAPALSPDGQTLYVAVNTEFTTGTAQTGYLLALDSTTLALKAKQALRDPRVGALARVNDSSSASPLVGPDGDVYYGVIDGSGDGHNSRGWLLHFDATLATVKTPGSFGWDDTPSIVPVAMLPTYGGSSPYLLLCKYNNYYGAGSGNGINQMAVLDPQDSQLDRFTTSGNVNVMRELLLVTGLTPDVNTVGGVREWCVNTGAVDPQTSSVLINNEDGRLYRWHLPSNSLSENVRMNSGIGQAYTPTAIGPDGIVYAVNNAQLHAVGR